MRLTCSGNVDGFSMASPTSHAFLESCLASRSAFDGLPGQSRSTTVTFGVSDADRFGSARFADTVASDFDCTRASTASNRIGRSSDSRSIQTPERFCRPSWISISRRLEPPARMKSGSMSGDTPSSVVQSSRKSVSLAIASFFVEVIGSLLRRE